MKSLDTVLITGTTNGIGKALLAHYYPLAKQVICVNRRSDQAQVQSFPNAKQFVIDISSRDEVFQLFKTLESEGLSPKVCFLNAGINKTDNLAGRFDFQNFHDVLNTNLLGTMSFVSAAQECKLKGITFLGFSSVSNLVPNQSHMAYYLTKWGILKSFEFLQKNDPENFYKILILGPIRTGMLMGYEGPKGFKAKLRDWLTEDPKSLIPAIESFLGSQDQVLRFPIRVFCFYWIMRWVLRVIPGLYKGTESAALELKSEVRK